MSEAGVVADQDSPILQSHHRGGQCRDVTMDAGRGNRTVTTRVVVSCGDAGLAEDYCRFPEGSCGDEDRSTLQRNEVESITQTISTALRASTSRLLTTGVRALLRGRR